MTVVATVVSVPAPDRAVVDAGSKTLSSDPLRPSPEATAASSGRESRLDKLCEEHGVIAVAEGESFRVGERVRILPNHACVVANLHDRLVGVQRGQGRNGAARRRPRPRPVSLSPSPSTAFYLTSQVIGRRLWWDGSDPRGDPPGAAVRVGRRGGRRHARGHRRPRAQRALGGRRRARHHPAAVQRAAHPARRRRRRPPHPGDRLAHDREEPGHHPPRSTGSRHGGWCAACAARTTAGRCCAAPRPRHATAGGARRPDGRGRRARARTARRHGHAEDDRAARRDPRRSEIAASSQGEEHDVEDALRRTRRIPRPRGARPGRRDVPVRQGAHDRRLPGPPHLHERERQVHRLHRHDPGRPRQARELDRRLHDPGDQHRHERAPAATSTCAPPTSSTSPTTRRSRSRARRSRPTARTASSSRATSRCTA